MLNNTKSRYGKRILCTLIMLFFLCEITINYKSLLNESKNLIHIGNETYAEEMDNEAPTAPNNLINPSKTTTSAGLIWDGSTDNIGVVGYKIYRDGVETGTSNTCNYCDIGLTSGTKYIYTVKAYDAAGNVSDSSSELCLTMDGEIDTEAPTAPSNLYSPIKTTTSVSLQWEVSTDNVGVEGYRIYRDKVEIDTSSTCNYNDIRIVEGTTYIYAVKAYDAAGNVSIVSNELGVTVECSTDSEAPAIPQNIICLSISENSVDLIWDNSTDNIGIEGYKIFRNGIEIGTSSTTDYIDSGLEANVSYIYTIKAYDMSGNLSEAGNELNVHTGSDIISSIPGTPLKNIIPRHGSKNSSSDILRDKNFEGVQSSSMVINSTSAVQKYLSASTGAEFTIAILDDITVKAWGRNAYGQLGLGDTYNRNTPTTIPNLSGVRQLSAGNAHILALMEDGTVKVWGYNNYGQLGLGDTASRNTPTTIPNLTGVKQVAAGYDHSLVLLEDGTVKVWGNNSKGQLGLGDNTNRTSPVIIYGISGVSQLKAGLYDSFALMNDGTVMAWGANDYGKLGIGDTSYTYKNIPTNINGLSGVSDLVAGYDHVLALLGDGSVKAWGNNAQSRLGMGDTTNRSSPSTIPGLSGVVKLSAGRLHSIACLEDGTVLAWGANPYGQLGVGDTLGRTTPTIISGYAGILQIVSGPISNHSLTMMDDVSINTWGYNYYGQLGLGDTANRNVPATIPGLQYNLPPTINVVSPIQNEIFSEADVSYTPIITVSDKNNENLTCEYYIDSWTTPIESKLVTNTMTEQIVTFSPSNISSLQEGNHTIKYIVSDNVSEPATMTIDFKIDKSAPDLDSMSAISTENSIAISVSASDDISGLDSLPYRYTIGSEVSSWTNITTYISPNILIPNTQYQITCEAKDSKGHIANHTQTIYTKAELPSINIGKITLTTIKLNIFDNNPFGTLYQIRVNSGESYVNEQGNVVGSPVWFTLSDKSIQISGLQKGMSYTFEIKAKNGENIETIWSTPASGTTYRPLDIPEGLTTSCNDGVITFSWDPVQDATYYEIEADGNLENTGSCTSYLHEDLLPGTLHSYRVRAKGTNMESEWSDFIVQYVANVFSIDCNNGDSFNFVLSASGCTNINQNVYVIEYDPLKLGVIDLCASTFKHDITEGVVEGTSINITQFTPGVIKFTINKVIEQGKSWNGIINIIKFKSKIDGQIVINYTVQ